MNMLEQTRRECAAKRYCRRCRRKRELVVERLLAVSAAVFLWTSAVKLGAVLGKEG